LQITGATAAALDDGTNCFGARTVSKEPAHRQHQTSTESAFGMHFPIFASSQFVEGRRRIGGVQTTDRLIAG